MKSFFLFLVIGLSACAYKRCNRNPQIRKKCPVHHEALIKDTVINEFGAYCSIEIDRKMNPYPRVGICVGCIPDGKESIIKYCSQCGEGH